MLDSLRLRNLRSFSNDPKSPFVDLKPLTVFVGKNSSGKSSFLRSLPLLRQSVETKTTGPILWYGSYVDFGAFSEAKRYDSPDDLIYFDFKIQVQLGQYLRRKPGISFTRNYFSRFQKNTIEKLPITIKLGVAEEKKKTVAKELTLYLLDHTFHFSFTKSRKCSLEIDDEEIFSSDKLHCLMTNSLLPVIGTIEEVSKRGTSGTETHTRFNEMFMQKYIQANHFTKFKRFFHPNTSPSTISRGINKCGLVRKEQLPLMLKDCFSTNKTFMKNMDLYSNRICNVFFEMKLFSSLDIILDLINSDLQDTFNSVRYIAPLRATAERYYRHQDLQLLEVDHTGSNLAMFLKSLPPSDQKKFSIWTQSTFGFSVRVEELGLHYALKIQTEDEPREYNINDMGFGFSQILPIIFSIWVETTKNSYSERQLLFVIEQPELHLHPELQCKLARLFASAIKEAKINEVRLKIIFETHSQTMVDTLGDCIEDNLIDSDDVNIVLFQKDAQSNITETRFSHFNEDGFLDEWPIGFFTGR